MELDRYQKDGGWIGIWTFESSDTITNALAVANLAADITKKVHDSNLINIIDLRAVINGTLIDEKLDNLSKIFDEKSMVWIKINGFGQEYRLKEGKLLKRSTDALLELDIRISRNDKAIINLGTRSDIWMPYDIAGEPHLDYYSANIGRLSGFMTDLSRLGFRLIEDGNVEELRHCFVSGYFMQNKSDEDTANKIYDYREYYDF